MQNFTKIAFQFSRAQKFASKQIQKKQPANTPNLFSSELGQVVKLSGVPDDWDERHLQKYFDPYITKIQKVVLGRDSIGNPNHSAFFLFERPEEADKFVERYHNNFINSSKDIENVKAEIYQPKRQETKLKVLRSDSQVELFNLPFEASNLDIITLAEQFAKVKEIQMPMRNSTFNKGFSLLTFNNNRAAGKFCEGIKGLSLFGRELHARQKYISFDTQKPRQCSKSDLVFQKAETNEIQIKGSLFAAAMSLDDFFEPEDNSKNKKGVN